MLYPVSLFIGSKKISTFNIESKDSLNTLLPYIDFNLNKQVNYKVDYLNNRFFNKQRMLHELKIMRLSNRIPLYNLVSINILIHFINNNYKNELIYLTCNDFKYKSSIKLNSNLLNRELYV